MKARNAASLALVSTLLLSGGAALAWVPVNVHQDALVRMPGSQPANAAFVKDPSGCFDCHASAHPVAEAGFAWRGSLMGQAARDPFFWAAVAVAAQDSIYLHGRPNATDVCLRCHLPKGWLEFRSNPSNGSQMIGADYDGVSCDFCHRMFDPFAPDTASGAREGSDFAGYWDESEASMTPSGQAAASALAMDTLEASAIKLFNATSFFDATSHPKSVLYDEAAAGQYYVAVQDSARGAFADSSTPHPKTYSRFHKSRFYCGTCHDVSNPAAINAPFADTPPNDGVTVLPSEQLAAHAYAPVERTFSELHLSDYGLPGGAPGVGPYDPLAFDTPHPGNAITSCQDCHMPRVTGQLCDFPNAKVRPTDSIEHPNSAAPTHDLTGGNALVPYLLATVPMDSPVHDPVNAALLSQGHDALTLDLSWGMPLDARALLAARNRTLETLRRAASIQALTYDPATGAASLRVHNHTGHKLPTGYPEGRRAYVTLALYQGSTVLSVVNPYDASAATLKGLGVGASPPLGPNEVRDEALVYEAHGSSSITGEAETFHFLLTTSFYKDNRIPPKGFRIAEAPARGAEPAWMGMSAPGLYTAVEYAGGYDAVSITLPQGGDRLVATLYYQSVSREYVEFLRDEINGSSPTLASPTPSGEPNAYVAQTDPFFSGLALWGDTLWQLWDHNKDVPGASPIAIAKATFLLASQCSGKPDGAPCDDGDACTMNDTCQAGACAPGQAVVCDDGEVCTTDLCDPALGCVHGFADVPCDDGDACTGPDTCAFGVCVPGLAVDCSDTDVCTDDSCDPVMGCVHTIAPGCESGASSSSSSSSGGASSSSSTSSNGSSSSAGSGGAGGQGGLGGEGGKGGQGGAGGGEPQGGCGCHAASEDGGSIAALALFAGLLVRRSKRRR